jgi:hypothetical protein
MAQQSNTATTAEETVQQRLDTVRNDPTASLCLGTDTDTDDPVTIPRTGHDGPVVITGRRATGKTVLCQHIAHQRMAAGQGVAYVGNDPAITDLLQLAPDDRADDITCVSPDTATGGGRTLLKVALNSDPGPVPICTIPTSRTASQRNTTLTNTLLTAVEQYLKHPLRTTQPQPYTIILDGLARLEADALDLDRFAEHSQTIPVQLVIALQSPDQLPSLAATRLYRTADTLITGNHVRTDADSLADHYPDVTAANIRDLPPYHWWVRQTTDEGVTETPLTSPPPHPPRRDITLDEYCEV